jgi:hypothetical protein
MAALSNRVVGFRHQKASSSKVKQATARLAEDIPALPPRPGAPFAKSGPAAAARLPNVPLRASPEVAMPARGAASRRQHSSRREQPGGDLVLGGILAVVLLTACIAWEAMSGAASEGALSGDAAVRAAPGTVH